MQEIHADKVLMIAIGNNDYISYNKLFDRYYGRLCQYVYSLLMDRNDAEDVVQELFLNLWKNRGRIEIKENVSGYLYRMAKHVTAVHTPRFCGADASIGLFFRELNPF